MSLIVRWLTVWLGSFACLASGSALVSGPEVAATSTNAVVRWTTDTASGSRVYFGTRADALTRRADGAVSTNHSVLLGNLEPGTTYHFSVGTSRRALATNHFVANGPLVAPTLATNPPPALPRPPPARVTWGNLPSLQDHFDRHGADFGARSPEDYAAQAWLFLQRARTDGLPAKKDEDGVLRVYDPQSKAFAAYNRNGTTRTYFKPNSRDYFERQPGTSVDLRQKR